MLPDNYSRTTQYLVFRELQVKPTVTTRQWAVLSKNHGDFLGTIRWWGAWRQYVIDANAVFNKGCMEDIIKFIDDAMADWRERKKRSEDSAEGPATG